MSRPLTYTDISLHEHGRSETDIAKFPCKYFGTTSQHGRSFYKVECGICKTDVDIYVWSFRGGGKRCPTCKGLFSLSGGLFEILLWQSVVESKYPELKKEEK